MFTTVCSFLFYFLLGFSTDGEFNSLRTVGNVRPISVIELIKNARNEVRSKSGNTIASYLTLDGHGRFFFLCTSRDKKCYLSSDRFLEVSVTSMNNSQLICTLFSFRSFENFAAS